MTREEAKITAVRRLQDAGIALCDVYFLMEDHNPSGAALEEELSDLQSRIRNAIGAVERLA